MQIGTRWTVGGQAPSDLSPAFVGAISAVEAELGLTEGAWTLTWLEGRPVAEHPADVRVSLRPDGTVAVKSASADSRSGATDDSDAWDDSDDDDDWLR